MKELLDAMRGMDPALDRIISDIEDAEKSGDKKSSKEAEEIMEPIYAFAESVREHHERPAKMPILAVEALTSGMEATLGGMRDLRKMMIISGLLADLFKMVYAQGVIDQEQGKVVWLGEDDEDKEPVEVKEKKRIPTIMVAVRSINRGKKEEIARMRLNDHITINMLQLILSEGLFFATTTFLRIRYSSAKENEIEFLRKCLKYCEEHELSGLHLEIREY